MQRPPTPPPPYARHGKRFAPVLCSWPAGTAQRDAAVTTHLHMHEGKPYSCMHRSSGSIVHWLVVAKPPPLHLPRYPARLLQQLRQPPQTCSPRLGEAHGRAACRAACACSAFRGDGHPHFVPPQRRVLLGMLRPHSAHACLACALILCFRLGRDAARPSGLGRGVTVGREWAMALALGAHVHHACAGRTSAASLPGPQSPPCYVSWSP